MKFPINLRAGRKLQEKKNRHTVGRPTGRPYTLLFMKYRDLNIQTQREAPNNARTEGFAFLVRAGYLTRENVPTQFGEHALSHLRDLSNPSLFVFPATLDNDHETFFPIVRSVDAAHCRSAKQDARVGALRETGNSRIAPAH
jgi:hypothetical protein